MTATISLGSLGFLGSLVSSGALAAPASAGAAAKQEADPHLRRIASSAGTYLSLAERGYESNNGIRKLLSTTESGADNGLPATPGGRHVAATFRTLVDAGARVGVALRGASTQAEVLDALKRQDQALHPMVMTELGAIRQQVAAVWARLAPHVTRWEAARPPIAKLEAPLAAIGKELAKLEATPPKRRVAALKKVPVEALRADLAAVALALAPADEAPGAFTVWMRLADTEAALATGTLHRPSGHVVPFDDDDRAYRRYRFVVNTLAEHHAAVALASAGTLLLVRAAVVQKRWRAVGPDAEVFAAALARARFGADPSRAARIRADLTGDAATDAKQRVVSVGEWLLAVMLWTDGSVKFAGTKNIRGEPVRPRALPVVDGTPWESTEEERRRRAAAAKAAPPTVDGRARARELAVTAARTQHGFDRIVHERQIVAETRYSVVHYGNPDIPGSASEVLIVVIADPASATDVAVQELGWNKTYWAGKPVLVFKAAADKFRGRQLFGHVRAKRGVATVPLHVLVFAR